MRPCTFTPAAGRYQGERCAGWQIMLEPGAEYHSLLHTLQLMRFLSERYSQFEYTEGFRAKLADPVLETYLRGDISFQEAREETYLRGDISFQEAREHVKLEEQKWIRKAKRFSLYDDQPYRIK